MDCTDSGNDKTVSSGGNLRTLDFNISSGEWKELEDAVAAIPVVGDRYNAEQQRQVGR
ncbi:hypothetical protein M076_2021 [Bacteroides fragilis str. 2-F-2 |uniref:Uncharacterized protein n=1 Tax=Bacteroides fragilis str. 2-F-2 \|nr:hypothetical protein M077_2146 [Bacteroides fragilis str. 2-F-2 \